MFLNSVPSKRPYFRVHLALDKFAAVIHNPAHRRVTHARGSGVLPPPGDHAPGRVHMADRGPGLEAGAGGGSRVAEEVEDADGPARGADLGHGPVPVGGLFGEEAGMLEVHGLDMKAQFLVADGPLSREPALVPAAAAALAAAIAGVPVVPVGVYPGRVPDGLGVRTDQIIVPPALQLFSF